MPGAGHRLRVRLRSVIQPADDPDGPRREIFGERANWEAARAELEAQMPEGWRRVQIIVMPED